MQKSIFKTFQDLELYTPAGIYLGKSAKYNIDADRILKVINKIFIGITYHEYGIIFPDGYDISTFNMEMVRINDGILDFITKIKMGTTRTLGNNVFTYWIRQADEDIYSISSFFLFYERVPFIGMTTQKTN